MGFGGQQGALQLPVYIPMECTSECVGSILTSGTFKEDIQAALLQHGCTQEDIDIMLEYVFIELLSLDFESIATENHIFFTNPISSLCFLAKERHKAHITHLERLELTNDFIEKCAPEVLYALKFASDFKEIYADCKENSPTGKNLTAAQCEKVALFFTVKKRQGEKMLESSLASCVLNLHKEARPAEEKLSVNTSQVNEQEETPRQVWDNALKSAYNVNPGIYQKLHAYHLRFWQNKEISEIEKALNVSSSTAKRYIGEGRDAAKKAQLFLPENDEKRE